MQSAIERNIDTVPLGQLGIIAMDSSASMGKRIDRYISFWRKEREHQHLGSVHMLGYNQDSFLIPIATPRFGSGEAKGQIFDSVKYIFKKNGVLHISIDD